MVNHFLKNINIIEYKCFKNFEVKDFQRVNLISGKNNVGKTVLLEACYINSFSCDNTSLAFSIMHIKYKREKINFLSGLPNKNTLISFLEKTKQYYTITNIRDTFFQVSLNDGVKNYIFKIAGKETVINSREFSIEIYSNKNVKNIDNFGWRDEDLIIAYEAIQKLDKEDELNSYINSFDNNIENFKVIGDKPQCKVNGEYIDIVEFGDGLKQYITVIVALYSCENGYLFIDEIDNGIHYTQLDKLWRIVFEISKEVNCQVFATTHSKEMIEAFNRQDDSDGGFFELYKNPKKNNEITYKFRDKEQLEYSLGNDGEFRGE